MIKPIAKKNIIWIALFSILFGCNNSSKKIADDSSSSDSAKHSNEKENLTPEKKIIEKSLIGRWCGLDDSESLFQIDKKEIFYYDADRAYKYTFHGNILRIKYDDYVSESQIVFKGRDTIIMIGLGRAKGIDDTVRRCSH